METTQTSPQPFPGAPTPRTATPRLDRSRVSARLIVDGRPFLVRGVELHNSSSSSEEALAGGFESARFVGANTVLAAVTWEDLEPVEGTFDLSSVTRLIEAARASEMRLIVLWFGAWKNGYSMYAPGWVKRDWSRFARCALDDGRLTETLSPFTDEALDAPAFGALMQHIEEIDGRERTVLMVQVENEVGLLGASRDHSHLGDTVFAAPVPQPVVDAVGSRPRDAQGDDVRSWSSILPTSERSDEAFMAYGIASHVERVARAGREHSALPLFVNAWLDSDLDVDLPGFAIAGGQRPGNYPSGGPLPHVADIWRACAPSIDLFAPDLYFGDSRTVFSRFLGASGGLFIPEMRRDATGVGHMFEAIGEFGALGVSPFGVDSGSEEDLTPLRDAYDLLSRAEAALCDPESLDDTQHGFFLTDAQPETDFPFGEVHLKVTRIIAIGADPTGARAYGIIRRLGPNRFLAVGRGFRITFSSADSSRQVGLESVQEVFDTAGPLLGRALNGDETASGTAWVHPHTEPVSMTHFPIPMGHAHSGISICRTYLYPLRSQ